MLRSKKKNKANIDYNLELDNATNHFIVVMDNTFQRV